jgi:hypothetical protein
MVGHETESVDPIPETAGALLQQERESVSVSVDKKDRLAAVTAENDVVESTGEMNAWFASHVGNISDFFNLSTSKPDPNFIDSESVIYDHWSNVTTFV